MQQDALRRVRARARHQNRKIRPRRVTPRGFPVPVANSNPSPPLESTYLVIFRHRSSHASPLCATSAYPSEKSHSNVSRASRCRSAPTEGARSPSRRHLQEDDWRGSRRQESTRAAQDVDFPPRGRHAHRRDVIPGVHHLVEGNHPELGRQRTLERRLIRGPRHVHKSANPESGSSPAVPDVRPFPVPTEPTARRVRRRRVASRADRGAPKRRERVLARLVVGVVESADPVDASPSIAFSVASIVSIVSIVSIASVAFDVSDALVARVSAARLRASFVSASVLGGAGGAVPSSAARRASSSTRASSVATNAAQCASPRPPTRVARTSTTSPNPLCATPARSNPRSAGAHSYDTTRRPLAAAARVKYPAPAPTSKSAAERLCAERERHERLRGRGLFRVPSTRLPPAVRGEGRARRRQRRA